MAKDSLHPLKYRKLVTLGVDLHEVDTCVVGEQIVKPDRSDGDFLALRAGTGKPIIARVLGIQIEISAPLSQGYRHPVTCYID